VCGEHITLNPGTYSGNFVISPPSGTCSQSNWLTISVSGGGGGAGSLPAEGTRTSPCYSGVTSLAGRPPYACPGTPGTYTAQIVSPNAQPALSFMSGESYIAIGPGIEITRAGGTGFNALLVSVGNVGAISNIVFDQVWIHGDELRDETETGINFSAVSNIAIVDSYLNDFVCLSPGSCTDSHAIDDGLNYINSTQDSVRKVVNNFIESSGEACYLSGGGAANTVPSDLEHRLNTCFHPMTWNPADPNYNGGVGGNPYLVKNLIEFKNMNRALVEGDIFSGNWGGFTQSGEAWKPGFGVNQSGNCSGCSDTNITMRYNYSTTTGQAIDGLGTINDAGYYPYADNSDSLHDNVFDNMGYPDCSSCETNAPLAASMWEAQTITTTAQIFHDASVDHSTFVQAANAPLQYGAIGMSGPVSPSTLQQYNLHFDNNIVPAQSPYGTGNEIGMNSCASNVTGGLPMFNACWYRTSTITGNCFLANGTLTWPSGNVTSVTTQTSAYTAWNNGNAGNYAIENASCQNTATDGTNPGANLTALNSVLSGNVAPGSGLPLTITVSGTGSVGSTPSGILCPTACMANYSTGTVVTLTAAPGSGWLFSSWSGACSGVSPVAVVTMNAAEACTATFVSAPAPTSIKILLGLGLVNGIQIH
jgi:hypothetical protein